MRVCGVILAAGQGKRMHSAIPKVLHKVGGRSMIRHVCSALRDASVEKVIAVLSPDAPQVALELGPDIAVVWQDNPRGTGDAARRALPALSPDDLVVVVCGDTPLLQANTIRQLAECHSAGAAAGIEYCVSLVTARMADPTGYGRILRDDHGRVRAIVEQGDLQPEQAAIAEVNAGIYCFPGWALMEYLPRLQPANAQAEYQLTDVLRMVIEDGRSVQAITAAADEVIGVNSRDRLAEAEAGYRKRKLDQLMRDGVTIIDPLATYVDADVTIGRDTVVWPQTYLLSGTSIGCDCQIGPGAHLSATLIGDRVAVQYSMIEASSVGDDCSVGPYAHLRPDTRLAAGVKVGNYAELKNTQVGSDTKISHHSYIGDADLGAGVNIGAGVVFVNYDGRRKHRTAVGDGAFIGCNVNLVSPVEVGARGYVACGSSITEDVPPGALAIARQRQTNIDGWVDKRFGKGDVRHDQPHPTEDKGEGLDK